MFLSFTRVKCRWRLKPFFSSATFSTSTMPLMLICLRFSWSVRGLAMVPQGLRLSCSATSEAGRWEGGTFLRCGLLLAPLLIGECRGRVLLKTRPLLWHQEVAAQTNYCIYWCFGVFFFIYLTLKCQNFIQLTNWKMRAQQLYKRPDNMWASWHLFIEYSHIQKNHWSSLL